MPCGRLLVLELRKVKKGEEKLRLTAQFQQLRSQIILLYKIAMMNAMSNNHEADGASGVRGVVRGGLELKHFRRHVFE